MLEMLVEIFGDEQGEALLPAVTEYELFMENSMLVPRREMLDWLRELAGQGKKIFIISDIYLPADPSPEAGRACRFSRCRRGGDLLGRYLSGQGLGHWPTR